MGDDSVSGDGDSAQLEYERLAGELDAALVFAAAAEYQYQNGNLELATACFSDARAGYMKVLNALPAADLTGAQRQDLMAELIRLRQRLDSLRQPGRNEAA